MAFDAGAVEKVNFQSDTLSPNLAPPKRLREGEVIKSAEIKVEIESILFKSFISLLIKPIVISTFF